MSGASDGALLDAHLAGDPDAFGDLFRRHRDVLWAVALRTTGNPADAEDALQDAMVSALRAVPRFERRSAVRTWLYRIVVNAGLDRLRRTASHPTDPLPDQDPVERTEPFGQVDARMDLLAALGTLNSDQRAAVVLVDMEGLPVAEAADVLEVPVGTVKSRCARARAQLAEVLAPGNRPGPADVEALGHVPSPTPQSPAGGER